MTKLFRRIVRRIRKTLDLGERFRFYLVKSAPLPDRFAVGPHGQELYCSAFNTAWFAELGIRPQVIVDVGSFDGGDALRFSQGAPEAKVITIEADPFRADLVRQALAGTSIEVIECAVTEFGDETELYRTTIDGIPSSQGSLYKLTDAAKNELEFVKQEDKPVKVIGRTLRRLISERRLPCVSLLHMDIQGAEYDALKGLGEIRPEVIYIEVNAPYDGIKDAHAVHSLMREMSYTLAGDFVTDRLYVRNDLAPR